MTLDQLLMFKTVAEAGSLKAASDKLHKTQPAISQSIKQLESQLDLILFNREGYRLAITEQGRQLLQQTQRVLNEAQESVVLHRDWRDGYLKFSPMHLSFSLLQRLPPAIHPG